MACATDVKCPIDHSRKDLSVEGLRLPLTEDEDAGAVPATERWGGQVHGACINGGLGASSREIFRTTNSRRSENNLLQPRRQKS